MSFKNITGESKSVTAEMTAPQTETTLPTTLHGFKSCSIDKDELCTKKQTFISDLFSKKQILKFEKIIGVFFI